MDIISTRAYNVRDLGHIMSLLEALTPSERNFGKHLDFEKGQILYHEGDTCPGIFIVSRGKMKIVSFTLSGREVVYNQMGEGECFGGNLCFSASPHFRGAVIGESAGEVLLFEEEDALKIMGENQAFLRKFLLQQSEFAKSLNFKIKLLSFSSARERVEYFLQSHEGKYTYSTITGLSETLMLSREALSRLLHEMEREGALSWEKKNILLK